ncbi:MFS transporter [Oscillatoria sp. FACHB-1406]|uniref:MFS transporter n=1 Tax=Oscillatoria sp. FACHB-1406 TaxID=2692846 RepID=UPI0016826DCE|nr:MFS transporter [Oscillatoria sp. FACHB-1406]MBD2577735.1 MFS transporter [Oscillatoria sp. FACHB-1406]
MKKLALPTPRLPALQARNYRLYFLGQGISLMGTWVTMVATVWLSYRLTQSPLLLGLVSFANQLPNFLLVSFGGVLVDRWDSRRTLLITQTLSMLQSLALAALALTGIIQFWHILVLSAVQGLINAVDSPTRQVLIPKIAEKPENLTNAIALNSSMVTAAKLVGPAVGGLIIAVAGAGYCFLIDAFSYLAVIIGLLAMRWTQKIVPTGDNTPLRFSLVWQNLKQGAIYAFTDPPIRTLLLLVAGLSFMGLSPNVVLPVFVSQTLHGSAHTLGGLMAASGVGALAGAVFLSQRQGIRGLGRLIAIASSGSGAIAIAFAFSKSLWFSAFCLFLIGFGNVLQFASSNTLIQNLVEPDKRGRVMSFYLMAFLGMASFGNLLTGSLIEAIGIPAEVALSGGICILLSVAFSRKLPALRALVRAAHPELSG